LSINLAIVGLPQSGRTTIFNALTGDDVDLNVHNQTNVGVAKVPDDRLSSLRDLFRPKKFTLAEVRYLEIGQSVKNLDSATLEQISSADALVAVVNAFSNSDSWSAAQRDLSELLLEISFSDMTIVEKRLNKIGGIIRLAKAAERSRLEEEEKLLKRILEHLSKEKPLRILNLSDYEKGLLSGFRLLTFKPMLAVINIGESDLSKTAQAESFFGEKFADQGMGFVALCGRLEAELSLLAPTEREEMEADFGINQSALKTVIRQSFALLDLISFFTVGTDEVRAWPISNGTNAQNAAGKIHTDIQRGFIRAEVTNFQNLLLKKTVAEVKKAGLMRLEGKTYPVADGDVINFLFSV